MPLPLVPRNSPFGPVILRARTVVQRPVIRLYTGSTKSDGDRGSDLKVLKKPRSAMLTAGTGQTFAELISAPSESNRLMPPT